MVNVTFKPLSELQRMLATPPETSELERDGEPALDDQATGPEVGGARDDGLTRQQRRRLARKRRKQSAA